MGWRAFTICLLAFLGMSATTWAGSPQIINFLPQVGVGQGIQSVILVLNDGEEEASLLLEFFKGEGNPLEVTIGEEKASTFNLTVPGGGVARFVVSSSSPAAAAGWAQLQSSWPVAVQLLFEISSDGKLVTQAAVEPAISTHIAQVFVDTELGNTGLALANISPFGPIAVGLIFKDETGSVIATARREIPAKGHFAKFVSEIFPEVKKGRGSLEVVATGQIALITLQQTGLVLGTLPVVIPSF